MTLHRLGALPQAKMYAFPLASITPDLVGRLTLYIRAWREATRRRGPFKLTCDNFIDTIIDLQCDLGGIEDPESVDGWLSYATLDFEGARYWIRDTYFAPHAIRTPRHIRVEARPRHKAIASVLAAADPQGMRQVGLMRATL